MTPSADTERYKNHRFPGEIISHGVWLYYLFTLSGRDVQELLFERGIDVTYEAIRQWCLKFGQDYANRLRRRRPRTGDTWHLDEVFLTIPGKRHDLWRAVDQDDHVLDILVQSRRRKKAAKKFLSQVTQGVAVRASGGHHESVEELRRGQARGDAQCGASAASLFEQSRGKLPSADPPTGAADATLQIPRARPAFPVRVWSHCVTFSTAPASIICS
jgi:hypothetical protein